MCAAICSGAALDAFLKGKARGLAASPAICEEMPSIENRFELASEKDEFGFPLIRIIHTFTPDAVGLWKAALDEGVEIAKGAGAKEIMPARGRHRAPASAGRHHHGDEA